jgi:AsmA family
MTQGRKRITRRVAMVCGVMLAVLFASWLAMPGMGITIPLDGLRDPIETAVSRALGREVHIDGKLVLSPFPGPAIVAHDVRIASPADQGEWLRAGRVAVQLAPFALLRGELHGRHLLIEDASIDLDIPGFDAHGTSPVEPPRLLSTGAALLSRQPELQEVVLHRVVLNYPEDSTGQVYPVELDEVSVHTGAGQPLELLLRGRFRQQPYSIELTGGQLADLQTPAGHWPLRVVVYFADTRQLLNANLETSRQGLVMTFELQADWPAEYARLAARFGQAPLAGRLSLHADQGRPVISGELQLPALDGVLRFGAGAGPANDMAGQPDRGGRTPADSPASVPLTVSIADVPFHGQLRLGGEGAEHVVELALSATDANAGRLLATLAGATGIHGSFRHIGFQASVHGGGEAGIVYRTALALQMDGARLSYGNAAGERVVDVTLEELALALPAGKAMTMHARGALLDEPFSVKFAAGGLEALLVDESLPISLSATGGGAVLDISGPLARVSGNTKTTLQVGLYGKRIGDLAAWLGVSPCAAASYRLRGQLVLAEDIGRLQFLKVQNDRTRLNGELDWSRDDQLALLHAVLNFEELDPADVEVLMPLLNQVSGAVAIDIPVLPGRVEVANADIDLAIAHILVELVDITDVTLSARIRDGALQHSPFHAHVGAASFQGYLDPTTDETAVVFENEDNDGAGGGRVDKLFSSAVRWVGKLAVVPLRWIFMKHLSAGGSTDCQVQGVDAGN